MKKHRWKLSLLPLILASCSVHKSVTKNNSAESKKAVKAKSLVTDSLSLSGEMVVLSKEALEKEFLLEASLITQDPIPDFRSLKSRVVVFKESQETLYMLEATQGHILKGALDSELILMSFPILSKDSRSLSFRFTDGIKNLFLATDMRSIDDSKESYSRSNEFVARSVKISRQKNPTVSKNRLVLPIVSQLESGTNAKSYDSVQTIFSLSPYRPNPKITPLINQNFRDYGFFETAPQRIDHDVENISYAFKFDSSKEITFYISSNTPAEFKDAIKNGVEYWNLIDPRLKLIAKDAPEGISAPNPAYNMIQWVEWEGAGSAHADIQADPRTGEILHANVFLTSAFASIANNKIIKAPKIKNSTNKTHMAESQFQSQKKSETLLLKNFQVNTFCSLPVSQELEAMRNLENISAEQIKKASENYLMMVVAHEIGHTLGLRHNFAGNLSSNMPIKDRNNNFNKVLKKEELSPHLNVTSSTMDYGLFSEDVIVSQLIKQNNSALSYDRKAIKKLYFNEESKIKIPFCTDHASENTLDCQEFDSGSNILDSLSDYLEARYLTRQRSTLLDAFLHLKLRPELYASSDFNEVDLSNSIEVDVLESYTNYRKKFLNNFSSNIDFITYRYNRPALYSFDYERENYKMADFFLKEIEKAKGLQDTKLWLDESWINEQIKAFDQMLTNEKLKEYENAYKVSFSANEVAIMKAKSSQFFRYLASFLNKNFLEDVQKMSSEDNKLLDHPLSLTWGEWLKSEVSTIVLAQKNDQFLDQVVQVKGIATKKDKDKKTIPANRTLRIRTPLAQYKLSTRLMAIKALKSLNFEVGLVKDDLVNDLDNDIHCHYSAVLEQSSLDDIVNPQRYSPEFSKWYTEEKAVTKGFTTSSSTTSTESEDEEEE